MSAAPPDWRRTLDDIGSAVADGMAALDRYEAAFAAVLAADPPAARPMSTDPPSATGFDDRLAAVRAAADKLDLAAAGVGADWRRWADAVSAWRRSVQQPPGSDTGGAADGDDPGGGDPAGGR